jgi:putative nucleotidyltransferase with HDIG domain
MSVYRRDAAVQTRPRAADHWGAVSAVDLDPEVEALLRTSTPRHAAALAGRERLVEAVSALALLGVVAALALLVPDRPNAGLSWLAPLAVVAIALASRVRFAVGAGFTSLVALVLVPTVFLIDPALAPLISASGMLLARLPMYLRREFSPDRMLLHVGDAWHAVGPAAVVALWGPAHPDVADLPLFALALLAQFLFDFATGTAREWFASGIRPSLQLRLFGVVVAVDAALAPVGFLTAVAAATDPLALLLVVPLGVLVALLAREREQGIESALALSEAYRGTALLMGEMLEADDAYTGGEHTEGVVALALAVGREMRLSAREQRDLEFGALLHDIGKLHTPDEIINKPGKLTDEEWEIIKRHPIDGQRMLERVGGVLADVGLIVRGHHERWDGAGYPDRIAGESIPLQARIICACDAYSAMTTNRSYRAAMPVDAALEELERCSGSQFDPAVVAAVTGVVERERPRGLAVALAA